MTTLFEKIVAGEIPADILYQDDEVTAFRDIAPQAPVHFLVITNEPIPSAADVEPQHQALLGKLFLVARQVAEEQGIAEDGYHLIMNCREHGGQEVPHIHLHVLGGRPIGRMVS